MPWSHSIALSRRWLLRLVAVFLLGSSVLLGWLWYGAMNYHPLSFYRSTNRYCSYAGFVDGVFLVHYDGGADQGLIRARHWRYFGVYCESGADGMGWQSFECGISGHIAVGLLGVGWSWLAWRHLLVPLY